MKKFNNREGLRVHDGRAAPGAAKTPGDAARQCGGMYMRAVMRPLLSNRSLEIADASCQQTGVGTVVANHEQEGTVNSHVHFVVLLSAGC